jgi:hypothetical protein
MVLGLSTKTCDSFQGLTGIASARDVLPEEVSVPLAFENNELDLFFTTTQRYIDHSSQLDCRSLTHLLSSSLFFCSPLCVLIRSADVILPEPVSTSVTRSSVKLS